MFGRQAEDPCWLCGQKYEEKHAAMHGYQYTHSHHTLTCSLFPSAPVSLALSLPAKSTRLILLTWRIKQIPAGKLLNLQISQKLLKILVLLHQLFTIHSTSNTYLFCGESSHSVFPEHNKQSINLLVYCIETSDKLNTVLCNIT